MSRLKPESDMERSPLTLSVNGHRTVLDAAPGERLLDALRRAGLLEIKEACGEGECGSCTILLDGKAVCSCLTLAHSVEGAEIMTVAVEGVPHIDKLKHTMIEEMGTQCGFCTPGMVLAAADLLQEHPEPDEEQVKDALAGNLCRCTGYTRIASAVHRAASELKEEEGR